MSLSRGCPSVKCGDKSTRSRSHRPGDQCNDRQLSRPACDPPPSSPRVTRRGGFCFTVREVSWVDIPEAVMMTHVDFPLFSKFLLIHSK